MVCDGGNDSKSGFALVSALLLASFSLLIASSLLYYIRKEISSLDLVSAQRQAEENAIFALALGLSRTQALTGNDQRITAPAGLLDGTDLSKENWIGVWDSSDWCPTVPTEREFLGWLVSQNEMDSLESVKNAPTTDDSKVPLFSSTGNDGSDSSILITPTMMPDQSGHFAFWIGDHSLKLSTKPALPRQNPPEILTPENSVIEVIPERYFLENLEDYPWDDNKHSQVNSFLHWEQLGLINPDWLTEEWYLYKNDLTLFSYGLLTNSRNGGWRKDLSIAFTDPDIFSEEFAGNRLFDKENFGTRFHSPSAVGKSFFGPRWEVLRDFALLHKQSQSFCDSGFPLYSLENHLPKDQDGRNLSSGVLYTDLHAVTDPTDFFGIRATPGQPILSQNSRLIEPVNNPLTPVLVRIASYFRLEAIPAEENGEFKIQMYFIPEVHLWNPFNISLQLPNTINVYLKGSAIFEIEYETPAGDTGLIEVDGRTRFNLRDIRGLGSEKRTDVMYRIRNEPNLDILKPGEIRIFSLADRMEDALAGTGSYIAGELVPFWNENAGIRGTFNTSPSSFSDDTLLTIRWGIDPFHSPSPKPIAHDDRNFEIRMTTSDLSPILSSRRFFSNPKYSFDQEPWDENFVRVSDLIGVPLVIGGLEKVLRGGADEDAPSVFSHFNQTSLVRGIYSSNSVNNTVIRPLLEHRIEANVLKLNDGRDLLRGFWGDNTDSGGRSESYLPFFEVPRTQPFSLGNLQHIRTGFFENQSSLPIANSLRPPQIAPSFIVDFRNNRTQIDLSWILNDVIFDRFYFSSVIEKDDLNSTPIVDYLNEFPFMPKQIYSNPRYIYKAPKSTKSFKSHDFQKSTACIIVDGQFNVNSISKLAWKGILRSLRGNNVDFSETPNGKTINSGPFKNAFFRHQSPIAGPGRLYQSSWVELSDDKVDRLAEEIVQEVKKRGPFMGLGDFVNRRLVNNETGDFGTIQAAIGSADINSNLLSDSPGSLFAPGTLNQADILTTLAPFISARGDTFTIRSYGNARDPTSHRVLAERWAEVVVRRIPEYMNPEENDYWDQPEILSSLNQYFGRGYEIISFRWLDKDSL